MALTSHQNLDNTGLKTGFWLEEFAAPHDVFKETGAEITLGSPFGRQPPPIEPKSCDPVSQTEATWRFEADPVAKAAFARTMKLRDVVATRFDAVFHPGGHGPLWDLRIPSASSGRCSRPASRRLRFARRGACFATSSHWTACPWCAGER